MCIKYANEKYPVELLSIDVLTEWNPNWVLNVLISLFKSFESTRGGKGKVTIHTGALEGLNLWV